MRTRKIRAQHVWLVALTTLAPTVPMRAEDAPKPTDEQRVAALLKNPLKLYGDEYDIRALSSREREALSIYRYERDIKSLRKLTLEGVKLTDIQKQTIRRIMDDQIAILHENRGKPNLESRRNPNAPASDVRRGKPAKKLGFEKARETGPTPRTASGNSLSTSVYDDPSQLVNHVKKELSADQVKDFVSIAYRWRVLRPFGVSDGPLRQLTRVVRDPELDITDEQRAEFVILVQAQMMELTKDRRRRAVENRVNALDTTRAKLLAMMTPEQRHHFEKTLKQVQTVFAQEVLMLTDTRAKHEAAQKKPADNKS